MSNEDVCILVVDDQPSIRALVEKLLLQNPKDHFRIVPVADGDQVLAAVEREQPRVILMDLHMRRMDGIEALEQLKENGYDIPVIIMSGDNDVRRAVEAIKHGAKDYLTVPFEHEDELILQVRRVLREQQLAREVKQLQNKVHKSEDLLRLMGRSNHIQALHNNIMTVAFTNFTVVIYGESGSGKELVARAIHSNSTRNKGPFVPLDCGSIPENLIEAELFGHERGAFTGAYAQNKGCFERAAGGTLLLDEIANLPKTMQSKLLRALQERKIVRVGGNGPIPVDIRVIVAGNRRLEDLVAEDAFREDLYHRLNEYVIEIPPLRNRKDDLIDLANRFIDEASQELGKQVASISDQAFQILLDYDWPGNVRELRNAIRRAVLLCDGVIQPQHLTVLKAVPPAPPAANIDYLASGSLSLKAVVESTVNEVEKNYISKVLEEAGGNKSKAAKMMQIDYKTMLTKASKYGLGTKRSTDA